MDVKLNRVDYLQVGLTSPNSLKIINPGSPDNHMNVIAVVGDHSGSLTSFSIKPESICVSQIFKTLPGPNAKITSLQVVKGTISQKILVAFSSSVIRGYSEKGKQFFGLELNNLTEPIRYLQVKFPGDVYICGHYIYNHYTMLPENADDDSNVIRSKAFYVSPGKITGLILMENTLTKQVVPIISCEDRLIRILKDSNCQYEIETNGIPNSLLPLNKLSKTAENFFVYGTLEGKVSLVSLDFNSVPLSAIHKWEIPEKGSRAQVNCIEMNELSGELYIGRSDGSIEVWIFVETLEADGSQSINVDLSPIFRTEFNCGESVTSICICREGTLLLCCTFTGFIFGLTRNQMINLGNDQCSLAINRDAEMKIISLKKEIASLEDKLMREREHYQDLTSGLEGKRSSWAKTEFSTLPYFAINDSFILQEDASYLLTIEVEIAIDSIIVQSDIPLDLVDCERNSAVVSFNENWSQEILATFRCQANTTRLEIKIRSMEGQYGILRVYIMTRMTPKSCQVKHYHVKALSLHKRSYNNLDPVSADFLNKLHIFGSFGLNESLNWLKLCLPEIPERISVTSSTVMEYHFVSTLMETFLSVNCSKGSLIFQSDNISTISILKDFLTREATKKSIQIEMNLKVNEASLGHIIRKMYPKLKILLKGKKKNRLLEAIKEIRINDPETASSMEKEIEAESLLIDNIPFNLERLYGLITDLYLDYIKLEGITAKLTVNNIKGKLNELVALIESYSDEQYQVETLIEKLNDFWGIQSFV